MAPIRNSALTVPCEATPLIGSPRHPGNCSSTSWRTAATETASWSACMSTSKGSRARSLTAICFRPPAGHWHSSTSPAHTGTTPAPVSCPGQRQARHRPPIRARRSKRGRRCAAEDQTLEGAGRCRLLVLVCMVWATLTRWARRPARAGQCPVQHRDRGGRTRRDALNLPRAGRCARRRPAAGRTHLPLTAHAVTAWHPRASVAADVRRRHTLRKSHPACPAQSFRRSRIQLLALPRSSPAALQWVHAKHGPGGTFGQGARLPSSACSSRWAHRPGLAVRQRCHHRASPAGRNRPADDQ